MFEWFLKRRELVPRGVINRVKRRGKTWEKSKNVIDSSNKACLNYAWSHAILKGHAVERLQKRFGRGQILGCHAAIINSGMSCGNVCLT